MLFNETAQSIVLPYSTTLLELYNFLSIKTNLYYMVLSEVLVYIYNIPTQNSDGREIEKW